MRRGKEEEKISSSPMFPRLHVNDADKGGPRAPPRNKMALYEQLSTPSQRFNSSSLPPPPQSGRNLGPQGVGHEGNVFSPVYASPSAPAYSVEEVNPRSFDGENMRTSEGEFERRSSRHVNFKSANAVGSVTECSALHQRGSNMNSCQKRVDDDDDGDFMVPTFVNSENALYRNKDTTGEKKRLTILQANSVQNDCHATFNSSVQLPSSLDVPLEQTSTSDAKSGKHERKCNEENLIDAVVMEVHAEKNLSQPEAGEKPAESSRLVKSTSALEHAVSRCIRQESCGNGALDGPIARSESQSKASHGHRSMNVDVICNRTSYDKENRSLGKNDADKNDEMSDTSMVDSVSGLEISPDDVVGVIGPKQFWKARRAIVNQQRVFAVQVFELHRLIKVQKLLAASPHLLLEENSCATSQKVPIKNLPIEPYSKSQSQSVKQKDDSQKPNQNTDYQTESTGVAPLSAHNDVLNKAAGESPRCAEPYSGNTHPVPPASENRSNPWCFQPPAHQWLVPVMSPSEGLIYKPYAGPCPPTAGFTAPVYGNYSPMSLPPGYTVPPCPQQNMGVLSGAPPIAPNYLPTPYGLPAMNPMISNSAVEQMSPMAGPRPNLQTEQNSRSSCNMSFPKSDAFTGRPWKARASKDSELQGSTASSPCERAQGEGRDALSLFPMAPTAEASAQPSESNGKEHQTRVIRVVPHNARSATESAARIFRSIQEERQQLDQ